MPIFEVLAVVVFGLGLVGWLWVFPVAIETWMRCPDLGEGALGVASYGCIVLGASFLCTLLSVSLAIGAERLPMWFRVVTVLSPAFGCVVGAALLHRALGR